MTAPIDIAIDIMRAVGGRSAGSTDRGALFSDDPAERHRFLLWRTWNDELPVLVWWMLNPSKADHEQDDATIRRCIGWARRWGYGGVLIVNAYALRSTDPFVMLRDPQRVGHGNDDILARVADLVGAMPEDAYAGTPGYRVIVAWGDGIEREREHAIVKLLLEHQCATHCLGYTRSGQPRHPVRLPYETAVERWPA